MNPNTLDNIDSIPLDRCTSDGMSIDDIRANIQSSLFDFHSPPEPLVPRLYVNNIPVSHAGGVTAIMGGCKRGKSNYAINGQAAVLGCSGDCLGWSSDSNPYNHAVIHMDTEQSRQQCDTMIRRRFNPSCFTPPDWYRSVSAGHWGIDMLAAGLDVLVSDASRDFGGIHSIWLDGCSDFLPSVNNEAQSVELVKKFTQMAREYNCSVVVSLHVTQTEHGGVNGRGHLGRELERKAETVILLSGTGEVTKVSSLRSRNKPITGGSCVYFQFSETHGRHVTTVPQCKSCLAPIEGFQLLLECWRGRMDQSFILADIYRNTPKQHVSESTKRNWMNKLEVEGLVSRSADANKPYSLTDKGRELIHELIEGEETSELIGFSN